MKNRHRIIKVLSILLVVGLLLPPLALAAEGTIKGTVEQTDQGIVINAVDGDTYKVHGQDLSDMVGKTVEATGTLAEDASGKSITVIIVEEVQE